MQVIRDIVPVLGSDVTNNILNAVSPLLTSTDLDKRIFICDLLEALARADPSVHFVVLCEPCSLFRFTTLISLFFSCHCFLITLEECRQNLSRT